MTNVTGLKCIECGDEVAESGVQYLCESCGGNLEVIYDYDKVKIEWEKNSPENSKDYSIWRYAPLLPVEPLNLGGLNVGWTPLVKSERLREMLEMPELYLKDDTQNPTASLKDRATAIALSKAVELNINTVTCASTGNAASSLSGLSAAIGLTVNIFVPENAPLPKISQMLLYGAKVFKIRGNYDEAFDLCVEATNKFGWYNRNSGYNPYLSEGKKSVAFEICEQLGWEAPDVVIVPVGDGCIIGGVHKGFYDLLQIGVISKMPRLIAVQAEGAKPIVEAFKSGGDLKDSEANTIADGIAVGKPRDGNKALRAIRDSNGSAVAVSDNGMLESVNTLSSVCGVFVEPSAAASLTGLRKCLNDSVISNNDRVVLLLTGHGLKAPEAAIGKLKAREIEPDISAVISES